MKKIDIALLIGVVLAIMLTSLGTFANECEDIRQSVVRLHILANSDSVEDQALKLAVRDAVLEKTASLFTAQHTKQEAKEAAQSNLELIEETAREEIARQGYDYDVTARVTNLFFDTRVYDDFTLAAGNYDAVQIEIGSGEGKNWWCVMFPPMCIPAASEDNPLPLEDQIRDLGQPVRYKPAFAIVEAIESLQKSNDNETPRSRDSGVSEGINP